MKLVIVVPDGMADWRYSELGNLSPAEYAATPGMDQIVKRGQIGLVKTMHDGLPLGSLVGIMGILGYKPPDYFPLGRSIFEAQAHDVSMSPADLCFRCNVVSVSDEGILTDFTSGQISDQDSDEFLSTISLPDGLEIHHDQSYRNVLIYRDCPLDERQVFLFEPHENVGNPVDVMMPRHEGRPLDLLVDVMRSSRHNGRMLWPWGAGRVRAFPPVPFRLLVITALSFLKGMGVAFGGLSIRPPGTTGYLGSNLGAKLATALDHLDEMDVVMIHCNAPDEEAHLCHFEGKARACEEIDRGVIVPLIEALDRRAEPYRLLLIPDHYTVAGTGRHLADKVPYAVMGHGLAPNHDICRYSEAEIIAAAPPTALSHNLVKEHFLDLRP